MKIKSQLGFTSIIMGLLFCACNVSNQASSRVADDGLSMFGDGVDSIKVEVSSRVGGTRSIILKENADAVARFEYKPDITLSSSITDELIGLADSLFVKKTCKIILSQVIGRAHV